MNNSSHEMSEYITKVPKLPFYSGLLKSSQLLLVKLAEIVFNVIETWVFN